MVEVFRGNTNDLSIFGSQVKKAAGRFGCENVTFVGDRGMIKRKQIEQLNDNNFHFIGAITKAQIEKLLGGGLRYILRRNLWRAGEIAANRSEKQSSVERLVEKKNWVLLKNLWVEMLEI